MVDDLTIWDQDTKDETQVDTPLLVDIDGFEGPLDLLLSLARTQKVDLTKISILKLAEQYLAFIDKVREMRLELAADYLVMAAWLAFLKSKLLLPDPGPEDEEDAEELADMLAFRLRRLEAMRNAANSLINGNRLGRDMFARGAPEAVEIVKKSEFSASLYDLLTAYAHQRQRQSVSVVTVKKRNVWSLKEAREALQKLMGMSAAWTRLDEYLIEYCLTPEERTTALASSFSASLELVREGALQMRQSGAFEPIYMRGTSAEEAE